MVASPSRTVALAGAAVGAAGLAALGWGLIERNRYRVRVEQLPVLAPGANPIRVLHLADLHIDPSRHAMQSWVAELAETVRPDLVVSTGDQLGHVDGLVPLRRALGAFAGIPGVFVHGSHDYYGPSAVNPFKYFLPPSRRRGSGTHVPLDTAALEDFYRNDLGWVDLNNRGWATEIEGSQLEFLGTGDAHVGQDRLDLIPGIVERLRESESAEGFEHWEATTIGVTHAPYRRVLDSLTTHGASVIFAGHTHGGQVRIPGGPALVTNCDLPREQADGVSIWYHARRSAFLEVSAGLGTSMFAPVRFGCPPEAVVVDLIGSEIGYA